MNSIKVKSLNCMLPTIKACRRRLKVKLLYGSMQAGLLFYLFASCSENESIRYLTDLEQDNINGPVIRLVTETYQVDSLGQTGNLESVTIEIFNKLGYTITDSTKNLMPANEVVNFLEYNRNGSLSSVITFENGKKQSSMSLRYNGDRCTLINMYDVNAKLQGYYDNISQTKRGLLLSVNSYDSTGSLVMSFVNEYDSIYQTRATAKDRTGTVKSDIIIHLTENKQQKDVLEVSYFKDSSTQKHLFYNYDKWDSVGNWIQQTVFDDDKKPIKIVNRIFWYRKEPS